MMVLVVPSSTLFKLLLLLSLFMLLLLFNRRRATSSLVIFEVLKFSNTSRTCSSLSIFTSSFLPPLILLLISDAMLLVYENQKTRVFCLLFTIATTATTNLLRAHRYTHKLTRARDSFSFSFSFSACQTDFVVTVRFPNTQVRYFCLFNFVRNARLFFNQFFSRPLHNSSSHSYVRESL